MQQTQSSSLRWVGFMKQLSLEAGVEEWKSEGSVVTCESDDNEKDKLAGVRWVECSGEW